jgi:hypothetical protein
MGLDLRRSSTDWLVCTCGNQPHIDGFFPCNKNGEIVEPDVGGPWIEPLYICSRCDSIYNADLLETVGTKVD